MEYEAIFIYCLAECVVNFAHIQDDPQSQMTHAEIITFVMISTLYYQCNMWLGSISKSNFYSKSLRKFCKVFLIYIERFVYKKFLLKGSVENCNLPT